MNMNSDQI